MKQNPLAQPPSLNYDIAKKTLVFRLSELMFGSLLAAYVLGFVSFSSAILSGQGLAYVVPVPNIGLTPLLEIFRYVLISGTFAYLTAATYMRYHTVILTMPTAAVSRSPWDFTIAVSQAALFGFSMLFPQSFLFCVAVALLISFWRQNKEFSELINFYVQCIPSRKGGKRKTRGPVINGDDLKQKQKKAEKESRKLLETKVQKLGDIDWRKISSGLIWGVRLLAAIGGTIILLPFFWSGLQDELWWIILLYLIPLALFIGIIRTAFGAMKKGAIFMVSKEIRNKIDEQYRQFDEKLRNLARK